VKSVASEIRKGVCPRSRVDAEAYCASSSPGTRRNRFTYFVFTQMLIFTGNLYFSTELFKSYFCYNSEVRNGGVEGISVVISVIFSLEFWCKFSMFGCNWDAPTIAARNRKSSTNIRYCVYSFELLMMGGGTA